MANIAFNQQSFLANALNPTFRPNSKNPLIPPHTVSVSCGFQSDGERDSSRKNENQLAKLAIVTLAAGVLALGSVNPASAASGGRVGGKAFKSSAPRASRPSGPRINNSRTNIYVNPPLAPPLVGGYGYGYGVPFYGGWGWSPFSFFSPGPTLAIGGGFDTLVLFMLIGAATAVVRRFFGSGAEEKDDDY